MSSHHPYYRRVRPSQRNETDFFSRIDFSHAHLEAFENLDAVAKAVAQFDDRVAAVVRVFAGPEDRAFWELPHDQSKLVERGLLESHEYSPIPFVYSAHIFIPTTKCLAILAYPDFFSTWGPFSLNAKSPDAVAQAIVSEAILSASPGWCGTFGPFINSATDIPNKGEGNYDMAQMHLLPMAYRYYDRLTAHAREHLITSLLGGGTVHGPGNDDSHTSGFFLGTWSRAGMVSPLGLKKSIGETENHILMIMTARYLTNQLLYQRDPQLWFDNRRNSIDEILAAALSGQKPPFNFVRPVAPHKEPSPGSCAFLLLDLLQRILRDDFSEYNAKGYQQETRWALVNLHSYAYDHEIRLAAKMVLDYLSARFVTSTNDLRRMVPFRRRNEAPKNAHDPQGYMTVAILDATEAGGGDPMPPVFAILAGNLRAYEVPYAPASWSWGIPADKDGGDEVIDALGDYRIPPSIHDLFVNDLHRRFYQRLHRFVRSDEDEVGGHRNADNMEIYAGSPSYLITAGGTAGPFAIDPFFLGVPLGDYDQQRGVAVTTSFMPTTYYHNSQKSTRADQLIQFSFFADSGGRIFDSWSGAWNYGVAPDFACGHQIHLPQWLTDLKGTADYVADGDFTFIRQVPPSFASVAPLGRPGFYLAIFQENGFALLEAYDAWLHGDLNFADFQADVRRRNKTLTLKNNVVTHYKTWNGNEFDFVIWNDGSRHDVLGGAEVFNFVYGTRDLRDGIGDAGRVTDKFLNGTVLNSTYDAVVEISNYNLGTKITLDMHDLLHPRRVSETGEIEQAGLDNEVYVDFDWKGPNQGDAFQPFSTLADATAAVADGGVIKVLPGQTRDRSTISGGGKRLKLVAPIGGVSIGVR
jgi:hypothetical protein